MSFHHTCTCSHDRDTHFKELTESTKDVNTERRYVYGPCLASWCKCQKYEEPKD